MNRKQRDSAEVIKYSHHENFPNTVDGKEVAEEVEVFSLECLRVLNPLLREVKVLVNKTETKIGMQKTHIYNHKIVTFEKNTRIYNIGKLRLWESVTVLDLPLLGYN